MKKLLPSFFLVMAIISCNNSSQKTDSSSTDSAGKDASTKRREAKPAAVPNVIHMITMAVNQIPKTTTKTFSFEFITDDPSGIPGVNFRTSATDGRTSAGDLRTTFGKGYVPLCPLPICAIPDFNISQPLHDSSELKADDIKQWSAAYAATVAANSSGQVKTITISSRGLISYVSDPQNPYDTIRLIPATQNDGSNLDIIVVGSLKSIIKSAVYLTKTNSLLYPGSPAVCNLAGSCRP